MDYKEIFKIAILLISSPAKAWEEIRLEDRRKVFTGFVYPMIGLCSLAVFLGSLFTNGWGGPESFQIAMTRCCVLAVTLFGGYFLAAYLIQRLGNRLFGLDFDVLLIQQFTGYSLVVTFLTTIVVSLLPAFGLIALILQFYIIYVVWEGVPVLMQVKEELRLKYTTMVSATLILCPVLVDFIFNKLLFILN